jgi:hypothetical protein
MKILRAGNRILTVLVAALLNILRLALDGCELDGCGLGASATHLLITQQNADALKVALW